MTIPNTTTREPLRQQRGHDLVSREARVNLPAIGSTDGEGFAALAQVKLFCPSGRYTFFVTEFDGDDLLYGWCVSPLGADCDEWGYASLAELAAIRLPQFGQMPAIERDLDWTPQSVGGAIGEGAGR